MLRLCGLNDKLTSFRTPSASSSQLLQQLECLLVCTEILHTKQAVCRYYCNKAQFAEVETFSHDLRADQYVDSSLTELLDGLPLKVSVLYRVAVQSCNPGSRE